MCDLTIYHNPRCSKSRQTLELIRGKGIEPNIVLYLEDVPSGEDITDALRMLGMKPLDIIRKNEAEFKEHFAGADELTNEQLAQKRLEAAQKREFRYAKEAESLLNPSFLEVTKYRWDYAVSNLSNSIIFGLGVILPLFLVGYWLVASGKMSNIEKHRTFFKVMCVGGLAFGIPVSIGAALIMNHPATKGAVEINSVSNSLFYFGQFALCAGYLGAIALLSLKAGFVRWFGWLSPIGKMALTNYIMHSVILSSIFYGYGFAQFGNIPRSEQMLMVVAIIVFQAIVSSLWLRVFNYGPLEWLWRCATYMKLQPMKRVS